METGTGSLGYDRIVIDYTVPLEELPDPLPIEPLSKPFDVTITPPGSKSITCRAYVLAALADGESKIIRPLRADDTDKLLAALCTLGAEARWDGEDVYIKGVNGRFPRGGEVNLGDGGAPTRFMIAVACLAAEPVIVDGSKRMRERPIAEGVDMLRKLGATIEYVEEEGRLPVRVVPSEDFKGGEIKIGETVSSQFISALMLIAPALADVLRLSYVGNITSAVYVNMTYRVMMQWKLGIRHHGGPSTENWQHIVQPGVIHAREFSIEPDASSAAYWWVAASLVDRAVITVPSIPRDSCQPDVAVLKLRAIDVPADLPIGVQWRHNEARVSGKIELAFYIFDAERMPDASITLAAAAVETNRLLDTERRTRTAQRLIEVYDLPSKAATRLTGLHTLRHKETDRIAALANELRKIGCTIETTDDSITIDPSTRHDDPVVIETYNDHRMAMAFGVLGLARPGISISNPACVSKSYPTFWRDFAKLYQ